MDLFKTIAKGNDKGLKNEARHELSELGGEEKAEAYEKKVRQAKRKALDRKRQGSRV